MNLYDVTLHGTNSIYLLASTKHRAQKLAGELITWRTNLANAKGRLYWQLGNHGGDRHGTALGFSFQRFVRETKFCPFRETNEAATPNGRITCVLQFNRHSHVGLFYKWSLPARRGSLLLTATHVL